MDVRQKKLAYIRHGYLRTQPIQRTVAKTVNVSESRKNVAERTRGVKPRRQRKKMESDILAHRYVVDWGGTWRDVNYVYLVLSQWALYMLQSIQLYHRLSLIEDYRRAPWVNGAYPPRGTLLISLCSVFPNIPIVIFSSVSLTHCPFYSFPISSSDVRVCVYLSSSVSLPCSGYFSLRLLCRSPPIFVLAALTCVVFSPFPRCLATVLFHAMCTRLQTESTTAAEKFESANPTWRIVYILEKERGMDIGVEGYKM